MSEKLKIFANASFREEKEYVLGILMTELPGVEWELVVSSEFAGYLIELPNGGSVSISDAFFGSVNDDYLKQGLIPAMGSDTANPFDHSQLAVLYGEPVFSLQDGCYHCGLDLFASAFFMVTRWEEYVLPFRDQHGRFPGVQSLAFRSGWLDRPVVHEWSNFLRQILDHLGFRLPEKQTRFKLEVSCDVDHPRLWWRSADWIKSAGGALFKRYDLKEALYWINHRISSSCDPYDVFDEWQEFFDQNNIRAQFNYLSERTPGSDCWYPIEDPQVLEDIRKLVSRGHTIGLHASYESFENPELIKSEFTALERITGLEINDSRTHYLRFRAPDTWRWLSKAGLATDHSAGYPDVEGFRTGMCIPYQVFDFLNRKRLPLQEHPLIAMDVTLALYRRYTPEKALERLNILKNSVLKYNGTFTLLWHNSSWNTLFWEPWKRVFTNFIRESRQL